MKRFLLSCFVIKRVHRGVKRFENNVIGGLFTVNGSKVGDSFRGSTWTMDQTGKCPLQHLPFSHVVGFWHYCLAVGVWRRIFSSGGRGPDLSPRGQSPTTIVYNIFLIV